MFMKGKSIIKIVSIFSLFVATTPMSLNAQNGEATFKQTCGVCHSIGKGKMVGPDLKDVNKRRSEEWILKFVKSSQTLIKSGDADAKAVFDEFGGMVMPDQNLADADIKSVIAYIAEQSGGAVTEPVAEAKPEAAPVDTANVADLIAKGRALFEGNTAFVNGGASCLSCHNVNYKDMVAGGVLAKDLTNCFGRLGGDAGISGLLSSPPFPAMTQAFKNNPLTPDEIKAISAFLKDADNPKAPAAEGMNPLLMGGFVGFLVLFGLIMITWNKRKISSTKREYHDRQIKTIN